MLFRSEAGEKEVIGGKGLAVPGSFGDDFNDPARAEPPITDVFWRLYGYAEDARIDFNPPGRPIFLCRKVAAAGS